MINKIECKKLINKILNKKRFYDSDNYILEFLNKNYKYYILKKHIYGTNFVIYHKKYNIHKLNKNSNKKYAKNLGDFYTCATNNFRKNFDKYKYLVRPVISVSFYPKSYSSGNKRNIIYFELFAQMCPPQMCIKNFDKFILIKNKYQKYIKQINDKFHLRFELQTPSR